MADFYKRSSYVAALCLKIFTRKENLMDTSMNSAIHGIKSMIHINSLKNKFILK